MAPYAEADATLAKHIKTYLGHEVKYPNSPVPQEQLGRVDRHFGVEGWEERLRLAADRYVEWFRDKGYVGYLLAAANCRRILGDHAHAHGLAAEAVKHTEPGPTPENSINALVGTHCAALTLADDLAGLSAALERWGPNRLGLRWTPVAVTAGAVLEGDRESVVREVERWRKLARREAIDHYESPGDRDLLEILERWLATLPQAGSPSSDPTKRPTRRRQQRGSANVIGPLPGVGASRLGWDRSGRFAITLASSRRLVGLSAEEDVWEQPLLESSRVLRWSPDAHLLAVLGETALIDDRGTMRIHGDMDRLALSPSARWMLARSSEGIAILLDSDGSAVDEFVAHAVEWHPADDRYVVVDDDGLHVRAPGATGTSLVDDDTGTIDASWSTGGEHIVVSWPHEPFSIIDAVGKQIMSFPPHDRDPNTGASLGTSVLATGGGDHRVTAYDLVGRSNLAVIDLEEIPLRVALSPDDRFVLVHAPEPSVWRITDGEVARVGPTRPATYVAWNPSGSVLACCDGSDLWLERYD